MMLTYYQHKARREQSMPVRNHLSIDGLKTLCRKPMNNDSWSKVTKAHKNTLCHNCQKKLAGMKKDGLL